jgi:hypothetical protein
MYICTTYLEHQKSHSNIREYKSENFQKVLEESGPDDYR